MKKRIILFTVIILISTICYANEEKEIKNEDINNKNIELEKPTGQAAPIGKFEYKPCDGDEKTKGCKVEDLIKKDDKNNNKLP